MTMIAEPEINEDINDPHNSAPDNVNDEIGMMDLIAMEHASNGETNKTEDKTPLPQNLTEHRDQLEEELRHGYVETQPTQSLTGLLDEMINNADAYHERTSAMQNGTYNKGDGSDNPTITLDTLVNTDEAVQGYVKDAERKVSRFAEEAGTILGKDGRRTKEAIAEIDKEAETTEFEIPNAKREIEEAKTHAVGEMANALYEEQLMMEKLAKQRPPSVYASRAESQKAVFEELDEINKKGQEHEDRRNKQLELEEAINRAVEEIEDNQDTPIERGNRWKTPEQVLQDRRRYLYESRPSADEARARKEAIDQIEKNKVLNQLLELKTDTERDKFLTNFRSMAKVMGVDPGALQEELAILSRDILNPISEQSGEQEEAESVRGPNRLKTAKEIAEENGYKKPDRQRYGSGGLNRAIDEELAGGQKDPDENSDVLYGPNDEVIWSRRPSTGGGSGGDEGGNGKRTGGPGGDEDDDDNTESDGETGKTIQQRLKEGEMIKAGEFEELSYKNKIDVLFDQERRQKVERLKIQGQIKRVLGEEELFGKYTLGSIKNLLNSKDPEMVRYIYDRLAKEASILVGSQWYRAQEGRDKGIEDPLEIREIHTILDERNKIRHFRDDVLKPMIDEFDKQLEGIDLTVEEPEEAQGDEETPEETPTKNAPKSAKEDGQMGSDTEDVFGERSLTQEDRNPLVLTIQAIEKATENGQTLTPKELYNMYLSHYRTMYGNGSRDNQKGTLVYTYEINKKPIQDPLSFQGFRQLLEANRENIDARRVDRGAEQDSLEDSGGALKTEPSLKLPDIEDSLLETQPSLTVPDTGDSLQVTENTGSENDSKEYLNPIEAEEVLPPEPEGGEFNERDTRQRQEPTILDNEDNVAPGSTIETQSRNIQTIANELRTSSALETLRQTLIDPLDETSEGIPWIEDTVQALETGNIEELTSRINFLEMYANYLTGESETQERQGNNSEAEAAKSNATEVNKVIADMQAVLDQATDARARQREARRLQKREQQRNLDEQNGYESEVDEN